MPVDTHIFGIAYLDADNFRASQALFGVGMAMCDYPDTPEGNVKLTNVLQAASRIIESFCGKDFSPGEITEQQKFTSPRQFRVNKFPVSSVSSLKIHYSTAAVETIQPAEVFINNQQGYLEITALNFDSVQIAAGILSASLSEPVIEVIYKSLQSVPTSVKLACGYQAAHLINTGFVDKTLPPNFGKIDMGGLSVNNKKGYRSQEEHSAGSISAEAERLLRPFQSFSIA
jgi:hypothetical protein